MFGQNAPPEYVVYHELVFTSKGLYTHIFAPKELNTAILYVDVLTSLPLCSSLSKRFHAPRRRRWKVLDRWFKAADREGVAHLLVSTQQQESISVIII
jgi:hypothetical protein